MTLFILLMQDSKLAKSPSSICMPQVQIRSLQSQLFMSFNPIMLKVFKTDIETLQTFSCCEGCVCVCLCVFVHVRPHARIPFSETPYFIGKKTTLKCFKIYEVRSISDNLWGLFQDFHCFNMN